MRAIATLQLLRPQQWVKNVFVLTPIFFAGELGDVAKLQASIFAMLAFCLVASSVYVLNDIQDASLDRLHPQKRLRPVAAGRLSMHQAAVIGSCLASCGLYTALQCAWPTLVIVGTYLAVNVAYCLRLKHRAIVDVFSIAIGFVLRVLAGGAASGIVVSQWLVIMTFLISLFLALGKRRDDLALVVEGDGTVRPALSGYTLPYVDVCMGLITAVLVMSYILYCLSPDVVNRTNGNWVYLSSVFVLAGMFRYLQITIVMHGSFSPTRVLYTDCFIQLVVLGWVIFFVGVLYG